MAETFPLFDYLPWELRNQIWTMAVRPDRPGAHIFALDYAPCDRNFQSHFPRPGIAGLRNVRLTIPRRPIDTDSPRCPRRQIQPSPGALADPEASLWTLAAAAIRKFSASLFRTDNASPDALAYVFARLERWQKGNPSTYAIDSSLWLVCTESRMLMKRLFGNPRSPLFGNPRRMPSLYPLLGTLPSPIVVAPSKDLFILRDPGENFAMLGVVIRRLFAYDEVAHVALEVNLSWSSGFPGRYHVFDCIWGWLKQLDDTCLHARRRFHIWLIDHRRYPPQPGRPASMKPATSCHTFHLSNCQLVEVPAWDCVNRWAAWDLGTPLVRGSFGSLCHRFLGQGAEEGAHFGVLRCGCPHRRHRNHRPPGIWIPAERPHKSL